MKRAAPQCDYTTILHSARLKRTDPRVRVLEILTRAKEPLRVKDIAHRLKGRRPKVDLVTIYRTIETLRGCEIVRSVHFGEDAAYYELNTSDHHHITCTSCGTRQTVEGCLMKGREKVLLRMAPDFAKISRHSLEYYGLCRRCAAKKR